MPLLEPHQERIAAALLDRFAAIEADGENYFYSISAAARVVEFEANHLDDSLEHLLFLTALDSSEEEGATERVKGTANFSVLVAKRDARAALNPFEEQKTADPIAATVLSRMIADVRTCLFRDLTLDVDGEQLAWNVMHGSSDADYTWNVGKWLCATLKFTVLYEYARPSR